MKRKMRRLLIQTLEGSSEACFQLGMLLLLGKGCRRARRLGRLFLEKAMDRGSEKAYFCYHHFFSRKEKVIDDDSYEEMRRAYRQAESLEERRMLARYLRLGSKERRRKRTGKHCTWKRGGRSEEGKR